MLSVHICFRECDTFLGSKLIHAAIYTTVIYIVKYYTHCECFLSYVIQCTGGKVYTQCGSACPPTCDQPYPVPCTRQCVAGDNITLL